MSETWLYVAEVAILLAAFPSMLWLRREGDRAWAEHVSRRVQIRLVLDATKFTAAIAGLSAQFAQMGAAAADMERSMRKLRETLQGPRPADLQALKDHAARLAPTPRVAEPRDTSERESK